MGTIVSLYGVAVGILVLAMWAGSLVRRGVPELETAPWEIRLHITAETVMAATLIAGGAATLAGAAAGGPILLLGFGMTLYSIVTSSGYYLQRRQVPPLVMFACIFALTAAAAVSQIGTLAG